MRIDTPTRIRPLRLQGLPADLRQQIKDARAKRGWGQRKLGAQVGLQQPHISAIESGEVVPRFDTLLDIIRVLNLDLLVVPRALVPAVQSLIRAQQEPGGAEERSLYAGNNEDAGEEGREPQ